MVAGARAKRAGTKKEEIVPFGDRDRQERRGQKRQSTLLSDDMAALKEAKKANAVPNQTQQTTRRHP